MATPKTAIEVPFQSKIADENGNITLPWLQALGIVFDAVARLREAGEGMEELTSASTATETIDVVAALRTKLLEIP